MLIVPSLVGQLLPGEELIGVVIPVACVAGIALIALGIACWPGPPLVGMLTYSALVTLFDRRPADAGVQESGRWREPCNATVEG